MVAETQKYRKYTERPQTDIKNLNSKKYRVSTQIWVRFALQPAIFWNTRLSKIQKKQ